MSSIKGVVKKGRGYGRKIGYPTANIENNSDYKPGVYAGIVTVEGKTYPAGIVVGENIEAHLIGFHEDLYGKEISLEIKKFLRDFKKFDTEKEFKKSR